MMWLSWPAQEVPTRLLLLLPEQLGAADQGLCLGSRLWAEQTE